MGAEKDIKKAMEEKKAILGRNEVVRLLKAGGLGSVFYADNCPAHMVRELEYYSGISKFQLERLKEDSAKLGQICGKPFNITVLGIKK